MMYGTLKFRDVMLETTGFCPITHVCFGFISLVIIENQATTTASFTLFLLRAVYLPRGIMGYYPENGYGTDTQSEKALKYFAFLEKSGKTLTYAGNPSEKVEYSL